MKHVLGILLAVSILCPVIGQTNPLTNESDSVSYSLGIVFGSTIQSAGIVNVNEKVFMLGINDAAAGKQPVITPEQANMFLNEYLTAFNEKKAVVNLVEGQNFLTENAKKEGVITTASGLQYKVIKDGEGVSPADTSLVTVHYTGTFMDGKVFDSSVERGQPAKFPVNGVIPGWTEALMLMKPGANWILYLPSDLAYGSQGNQGIPPNTVLIFDVQLIAIE